MKKYLSYLIIILLSVPSVCFGWGAGDGRGFVGVAKTPSGDSCTGTLLFSAHFENNDDVTIGTPAGCIVSGGDTTLTPTNYVYSIDQKTDGTYSAFSIGDAYGTLDGTNLNSMASSGTWCGDIYFSRTETASFFYTAGGPGGAIVYGPGDTSTLRAIYGGATHTRTGTIANDTFTRVCVTWDFSPAPNSQKLAVKINAGSWEESTNENNTEITTMPATFFAVGRQFQAFPGYVDNVQIYSDYQHAE